MPENARLSIKIHGQVQGVFFRSETKKQADLLDLIGWVKNNSDGTVECLAEGDKDKLDQLLDWCNIGSDGAKVDKVEVKWQLFEGENNKFEIK